MSTSQCKFNHANLFSRSWDISRQSFYSYWWPDISVICCCFCTSHICVDSLLLGLSSTTWFVKISLLVVEIQAEWSLWHPTRYLNNPNNLNSVIDLMFLWLTSSEFDNHMIQPEWRLSLDHTLLTINIVIIKEHIQTKKHIIVKNSEEEITFLVKLSDLIIRLDIECISSKKVLE